MGIVILVAYAGLVTGLFLCAYARVANASEERMIERKNSHAVIMEMAAQLTAMRRRAEFLEKNLSRPIELRANNEQLAEAIASAGASCKGANGSKRNGALASARTSNSAMPTRAEREKERQAIMEQKRMESHDKSRRKYVERVVKEQREKSGSLCELMVEGFGEPIPKEEENAKS